MQYRIQMLLLTSAALLCAASCGNQDPASSNPPAPAPSVTSTAATAAPAPEKKEGKKDEKVKDANVVAIDNFTFTPQELTVAPNTTVTWINHDDIPHTVKDTQKRFKSPTLDTDEKFSFTFTEPGTYEYFCTIHPHMTGKVIVK